MEEKLNMTDLEKVRVKAIFFFNIDYLNFFLAEN
jgi:hypothetical protein